MMCHLPERRHLCSIVRVFSRDLPWRFLSRLLSIITSETLRYNTIDTILPHDRKCLVMAFGETA